MKRGDSTGTGHIKPLLTKYWEQPSLTAPAQVEQLSLCRWASCIQKGKEGCWQQWICNIWGCHKPVQVPPQAALLASAPIRHSHPGEASKCSMELLLQVITVLFFFFSSGILELSCCTGIKCDSCGVLLGSFSLSRYQEGSFSPNWSWWKLGANDFFEPNSPYRSSLLNGVQITLEMLEPWVWDLAWKLLQAQVQEVSFTLLLMKCAALGRGPV